MRHTCGRSNEPLPVWRDVAGIYLETLLFTCTRVWSASVRCSTIARWSARKRHVYSRVSVNVLTTMGEPLGLCNEHSGYLFGGSSGMTKNGSQRMPEEVQLMNAMR